MITERCDGCRLYDRRDEHEGTCEARLPPFVAQVQAARRVLADDSCSFFSPRAATAPGPGGVVFASTYQSFSRCPACGVWSVATMPMPAPVQTVADAAAESVCPYCLGGEAYEVDSAGQRLPCSACGGRGR